MLLSVNNLIKSYNKKTIFDDISFNLYKDQKIGLVGNNGSGKSTLLKILAGIEKYDEGEIIYSSNTKISYMPQDALLASKDKVSDYLFKASGIKELEKQITTSSQAYLEYENRDGYNFEYRMNLILSGLGLEKTNTGSQINCLSSGQKSKIFLAGILLSDANLLLLDEPTNNLDIPALIWLENFIINSNNSFVIVSHDYEFLNNCTNHIFELDNKSHKLNIIKAKYTDYLAQTEKNKKNELIKYDIQQKEIIQLKRAAEGKRQEMDMGSDYHANDNDKFLQGFKQNRSGKLGKTAKAIEKRLEKIDKIEKPTFDNKFQIYFNPKIPYSENEIVLKNLAIGYSDNNIILNSISLTINYGHKVAFLGLNGSGKSTLLKTITGKLKPLAGQIDIGSGLIIGDLMQEHQNLPENKSIVNFIIEKTGLSYQNSIALVIKFGFNYIELNNDIKYLSPGQKTRLILATFSALSVNVLILDEPTNHLDPEAISALIRVIKNYTGTVLLASHDRYLLNQFSPDYIYNVNNNTMNRINNLKSYLDKIKSEAKYFINI